MVPRRIVMILYEASFGGVERQAELLAEAAKAKGHSVTLIVLGEEGPALKRFEQHCESIQVLRANVHNDLSLHRRLRQATQSGHDVAFIFSTAKLAVLSNALSKTCPRQILHVGNPVGLKWNDQWKQTIRSWIFRPSPGLSLVANSEHTLSSLQAHPFYRRFPLHVSPNCVRIPVEPSVLRERCEPLRIGMVARLDPIKDHATLIRAVGMLHKQGVPIECELMGRGPIEEELKQLAQAEGLLESGVVKFAGWSAEVDSALRRWDIFVFSTTAQEGFGNAAAEAMAYGLPCILTEVGPCRSVGGQATKYVPPQDAESLAKVIASLAQEYPERLRLAALARQRAVECFQPERKLADFMRIAWPQREEHNK